MLKVFELTIFLSSTMNMVTQIIYLGRMKVGDWYYAVCLKKNLNRVYGSLDLDIFLYIFFNRISSFWTGIF